MDPWESAQRKRSVKARSPGKERVAFLLGERFVQPCRTHHRRCHLAWNDPLGWAGRVAWKICRFLTNENDLAPPTCLSFPIRLNLCFSSAARQVPSLPCSQAAAQALSLSASARFPGAQEHKGPRTSRVSDNWNRRIGCCT
eukprot:5330348-Amphidinium_carterae.1